MAEKNILPAVAVTARHPFCKSDHSAGVSAQQIINSSTLLNCFFHSEQQKSIRRFPRVRETKWPGKSGNFYQIV